MIELVVVAPPLPHPLQCPDANPGYRALRDAYDAVAARVAALRPDVLLLYATTWPSVLGHQLQARPEAVWTHVDELFHHLGPIPYRLRFDAEFARAWAEAGTRRGLQCRTVDHHGFPIDTGSVVALKLLDPDGRVPAVIASSNVYCDRAETVVFAKAARDALEATGKRAVAVAVTTLSNRFFTDWADPAADRVHSAKDEAWNQKILEFLAAGRLEDVAQLSRTIHRQIRVKKVVSFKPMWFVSALAGAHNRYDGEVLAYAGVHGTGCAVAALRPTEGGVGDKEYDEEDVEIWRGDRGVLQRAPAAGVATPAAAAPEEAVDGGEAAAAEVAVEVAPTGPAPPPVTAPPAAGVVVTGAAPKPVGAYPHARRVGDLLFLSGIGPRQPGTDAIPGGPIRDADGRPLPYDVAEQTRAVLRNVRAVLEAAGSSMDELVDVTTFLVDMDRDFAAYNAVWAETFPGGDGPTRTTVAITALPTPIAVEMKVVARA